MIDLMENPTAGTVVHPDSDRTKLLELTDRLEAKKADRDRKNAAHVKAARELATVEFEIEELEAEVTCAREARVS